MAKRAKRRHHEERVKDKFRRVARDILSGPRTMSDRRRREFIERSSVRMAHHPAHQCQICREDRKCEKHRREFEARKKAPLEDE